MDYLIENQIFSFFLELEDPSDRNFTQNLTDTLRYGGYVGDVYD